MGTRLDEDKKTTKLVGDSWAAAFLHKVVHQPQQAADEQASNKLVPNMPLLSEFGHACPVSAGGRECHAQTQQHAISRQYVTLICLSYPLPMTPLLGISVCLCAGAPRCHAQAGARLVLCPSGPFLWMPCLPAGPHPQQYQQHTHHHGLHPTGAQGARVCCSSR
jgi:hypothetical protein